MGGGWEIMGELFVCFVCLRGDRVYREDVNTVLE